MEQYIPKAALVAEIEKRIKEREKEEKKGWAYSRVKIVECEHFLSFINTLEVKEVDLEKELVKWHREHFKKDGTFIGMSGFYLTNNSQMDIAKHFFELGLQVAQKGE